MIYVTFEPSPGEWRLPLDVLLGSFVLAIPCLRISIASPSALKHSPIRHTQRKPNSEGTNATSADSLGLRRRHISVVTFGLHGVGVLRDQTLPPG